MAQGSSCGQVNPGRADAPAARRAALSTGTCNCLQAGGCLLPAVTKYFSTGEVNESLAQLGMTPHQQFQLVPSKSSQFPF